ncbi:DUF2752 domain-containing protein [uncultured Faecalibaculum sp.]|uniref:DUF2752 domain-containing protein n=1 Tax=uncultured Faecalibaculum sp. TaxID=1729681 RepID=UPI0025FBFD3A|nr:DUF2752 domain-containing protein [uncultured Faecalibaculum sp.]
MNKRLAQTAGLCIAAVLFLLFFGWICPFQLLTGLPCPGCNMTTGLYWLLKGDLSRSFWYHPMVLPTLLAAGLAIGFRRKPVILKGIFAVWIILMLSCYVWRMLTVFPDAPMQPESGLFSLLAEWRPI